MTTEANFPPAAALSLSLLSMAAFHSIIYGRFWVITKAELTVGTVCGTCNNGWMSAIESENIPIIGSMFQDLSVPLNKEQQTSVAVWAVKTAIVMDSFKGRKTTARL
jgi:hypothetical protein